jgi:hypothetical protein
LEFREAWLGDVDQFTRSGGTGGAVNCNAVWLSQVQPLGTADAKFDSLAGNRSTAYTLDFNLDPGYTILVPNANIVFSGSGANRSVAVILLRPTCPPPARDACTASKWLSNDQRAGPLPSRRQTGSPHFERTRAPPILVSCGLVGTLGF